MQAQPFNPCTTLACTTLACTTLALCTTLARALQEPCRALQDPEGFNPPYLPLTPRIPPSCPRRARNGVLIFDLFFDRLPDPQKVTFSSQKKSTRYIRGAKNFSGASKNKNFPSSFGVFFGDSCGYAFQGRFWDEKSMKNR